MNAPYSVPIPRNMRPRLLWCVSVRPVFVAAALLLSALRGVSASSIIGAMRGDVVEGPSGKCARGEATVATAGVRRCPEATPTTDDWLLVPAVTEDRCLGVFAFQRPNRVHPPVAFWFERTSEGSYPYVFLGTDVMEAVCQVDVHVLAEPLLQYHPTIRTALGVSVAGWHGDELAVCCSGGFDFAIDTNRAVRTLSGSDGPNALGILAVPLGSDDDALFGSTRIACPEISQGATTLQAFLDIVARTVQRDIAPATPCEPNGCTWSPNAPCGYDFTGPCDTHDLCYCTCGRTRSQCDNWFCEDLHFTCRYYYYDAFLCHRLADIYCLAVRAAGHAFFCDAQREAGCATPAECQ